MLSDPLAIIGVFMIGASTGAVIMHVKYASILRNYRRAWEAHIRRDEPMTKGPLFHLPVSSTRPEKHRISQKPGLSNRVGA